MRCSGGCRRAQQHIATIEYLVQTRVQHIALRKVKGNTSDKAAFAAAVKSAGSELKSVRGPFRFNSNHMPVQNYYAFQVAKEGTQVVVKQLGTPLSNHQDSYVSQCKPK